jgi:hypothetical protein
MNDCWFQAPPAVGQFLPSAYTADLSEDEEISDSDDDLPYVRKILAPSKRAIDLTSDNHLLSVKQILAPPKRVIHLTCDNDDEGEGDDGNFTIIYRPLLGYLPTPLTPRYSLFNSLAYTADGLTTSCTAATPGKKKHAWINVPKWSLLHRQLQQRSDKPFDNLTVDALHAPYGQL